MLDANNETLWAMPVPPGQVRTALNPPSSAGGAAATGIATTTIATVAVAIRIFTRGHVVRNLGIDDLLVVLAWVVGLAFALLEVKALDWGSGHHIWDMPAVNFDHFMIYQFALTITYSTSVSFSKLSILTLYLRLSPERCFRIFVYSSIITVATYTVAYQFFVIFQCRPVNKFWMPKVDGVCSDKIGPMMTLSIANIVLDVIILLIPIKIIVPLRIPIRQKIPLIILFATGGFVCGAAIQRTILMWRLLDSADYTWEVSGQVVWGYVEVNAGIFCASVPALKPFFVRYIPVILASRFSTSSILPASRSLSLQLFTNKSSPRLQGFAESHKLPSRDTLANRSDNDQTKLWSPSKPAKLARRGSSEDDMSLRSFEDKYLGRMGRMELGEGLGGSPILGEDIRLVSDTESARKRLATL